MKEILDPLGGFYGIIKLLQYVSVSATVLEVLVRVIRYWLTH